MKNSHPKNSKKKITIPKRKRGRSERQHTLAIQKRKYTNEMMLPSINRKSCLLSLIIMGAAC